MLRVAFVSKGGKCCPKPLLVRFQILWGYAAGNLFRLLIVGFTRHWNLRLRPHRLKYHYSSPACANGGYSSTQ